MIPFETDAYFHIYNHANGNENLFHEERNYNFFLQKYIKYLAPFTETLAYVLMPNHFHILIKSKDITELKDIRILQDFKNLGGLSLRISQQFSNLFNSYTKTFNLEYHRKGSLFIPNLKRKEVNSEAYLIKLINYIHFNPVVHGFCAKPEEWRYSSYKAIISEKPTLIDRKSVLFFFDGLDNFLFNHWYPIELDEL
ncbi:MAG: transposase [Prolixibacteraceae bacterium]